MPNMTASETQECVADDAMGVRPYGYADYFDVFVPAPFRENAMANNKNQHFVPRCYLRPFTLDGANLAINVFNIERRKLIERAPVKNQCSGDYFYGKDQLLEDALKYMEGSYASVLREIHSSGYELIDDHKDVLRRFWLLQYMRTEAASRRAVEMAADAHRVIQAEEFRLNIREAVTTAMRVFAQSMDAVDDLKICLFRNRTPVPFVTSDDPAVLSNRWHLENPGINWRSFGLRHAGDLAILPMSPRVLCLGYDGDVYNISHTRGWVDVNNPSDVEALNQHQFLGCRANIFIRDANCEQLVRNAYEAVALLRPTSRHRIHYAVRDTDVGDHTRFRVIDPSVDGTEHEDMLIHSQAVHPRPSAWPRQLQWRPRGTYFSNGTGAGFVRRAWTMDYLRKPYSKFSTGR